MKAVYYLLCFVVLLPISLAWPGKPNYLTSEDFERGRSLPSNVTNVNRNDSPCFERKNSVTLFE